jgi:arylsulfatase A
MKIHARHRFAALSAVMLCLLTGAAARSKQTSADKKPNFVILLTDDLGYGDLACYGNTVIRSPNLERLAAEGLRLTNFYSASPVCSPSRAALLTGRVPQREKIFDWIPNDAAIHLRRNAQTIATLLKANGYATALIGKWHLNGKWDGSQPLPEAHGFEYWFATGGYPMPSQRNPENFYRNGAAVGTVQGYSSTIIADDAIAWLKRRNPAQPFFLFVSFHAPHEEVASADQYVKIYDTKHEPNRALYYANITELDYEVGRFLKAMDETGASDHTLVLFTSDNGPELLNRERAPWTARSYGSAGTLRGMKLDLYEGGIRVPAILRWHGVIKAGQTSDAIISATDILPTLCDLAGISLPRDHKIDGVSLNKFLRGHSLKRATPLYWQYDNAHTAEPNDLPVPKLALRAGDWKLLAHTGFTNPELYNLGNDPSENNNLAAKESARVKTMLRTLRRLHTEINSEQK